MQYTEGVECVYDVYYHAHIYAGAMVCLRSDGYAVPAADASGYIFVGIALEEVDNSAGASAAKQVLVRRDGLYKMTLHTAISIANLGDNVFVYDDEAVDVTANTTYDILVGNIAGPYIDTTYAWVDIVPAIEQADVATHIADTSAAHAASAISFADSGSKTAATEVDGVLDEIYIDLLTIQGFIPLPLFSWREVGTGVVGNTAAGGGVLSSDTTPSLTSINAATDACQVIHWAANGVDPIAITTPLPPDLAAGDLVLHTRIVSAGTTNAVGFGVDSWFNEGDTKVSDTSQTNQTATWAEKITTIAAADVPAGAQTLTLILTPVAHSTDTLRMSQAWLEYPKALLTS
jgi:hypothetical protein